MSKLEKSSGYDYLGKFILPNLAAYTIYLWGGSLRDSVVEQILGKEFDENRDIDILVDDSQLEADLKNLLGHLDNISFYKNGISKIKIGKDFTIDISKFSNSQEFHNIPYVGFNKASILNPEEVLKKCDFTVNSMMYDLGKNVIYDYLALDDIRSQQIDLLCPREKPYTLMCRIILLSEKLGFKIGNNAKKFIAMNYHKELDDDIQSYMNYRGSINKYQFLIERLREIKNSS